MLKTVYLVGLNFLTHNYGCQAISHPFVKQLSRYLNIDPVFVVKNQFVNMDKQQYKVIPRSGFKPKKDDVIINLKGIGFVGDRGLKRRWHNYVKDSYYKRLADRVGCKYLEYTQTYGPFESSVFYFFMKQYLNQLPMVMVRGQSNYENIKEMGLNSEVLHYPDISLTVEPSHQSWAANYLQQIGVDIDQGFVILSPSSKTAGILGEEYFNLHEQLTEYFIGRGKQVVVLPHFVLDGKNHQICDLAYCRSLMHLLVDYKTVTFIENMSLNYEDVRAIMGLSEFLVTGRYHALASALYMGVPAACFSWNPKYHDLFWEYGIGGDVLVNTDQNHWFEQVTQLYHCFPSYDKNYWNKKIQKQVDDSIQRVCEFIGG